MLLKKYTYVGEPAYNDARAPSGLAFPQETAWVIRNPLYNAGANEPSSLHNRDMGTVLNTPTVVAPPLKIPISPKILRAKRRASACVDCGVFLIGAGVLMICGLIYVTTGNFLQFVPLGGLSGICICIACWSFASQHEPRISGPVSPGTTGLYYLNGGGFPGGTSFSEEDHPIEGSIAHERWDIHDRHYSFGNHSTGNHAFAEHSFGGGGRRRRGDLFRANDLPDL